MNLELYGLCFSVIDLEVKVTEILKYFLPLSGKKQSGVKKKLPSFRKIYHKIVLPFKKNAIRHL